MTKPIVTLIVGDDHYLVNEEVSKATGDSSEFSIDEFSSESDPALVFQSLTTPSMFDEGRVVVIRDVDSLAAEWQRRLIEYLQDPTPSINVIMTSSKPVAKLATAVKKAGHVVDASKGKKSDLFAWLRTESKSRKLKIGQDAMTALLDAVGEERMALSQALDHLNLALGSGATVGLDDVKQHFAARGEAKLFGFIDAVALRQAAPALSALNRLFRQGESPQMLFWALARHFRMLVAAGVGGPDAVAKKLGLPPWRAEKLVRQARGFTADSLVRAYQSIAVADKKMKSSAEPEELTLERLVVEIALSR